MNHTAVGTLLSTRSDTPAPSTASPADRLLRPLVEAARAKDRPVFALSFPVDGRSQLGWEPPYSKSAFSRRQGRYSQAFGVDTYTPQIVENRKRVVVGSRARHVRNAIESALAEPARVDVKSTRREK